MAPEDSPTPETFRRTYRVIWFGFFAAPFLYAAVTLVAISPPHAHLSHEALLPQVITAAALTLAAFSIWWRVRYSSTQTTVDLRRLGTACIVAWALSEAVAVLGLILGLLVQRVDVAFPFFSGALALLYIHRPAAWTFFPRGN